MLSKGLRLSISLLHEYLRFKIYHLILIYVQHHGGTIWRLKSCNGDSGVEDQGGNALREQESFSSNLTAPPARWHSYLRMSTRTIVTNLIMVPDVKYGEWCSFIFFLLFYMFFLYWLLMFCLHNLLGYVVEIFICLSQLSDKVETWVYYITFFYILF